MAEQSQNNPVNPPTNTQSGTRRRSSGFMPAFESLSQQRRDADPARRQSISEQAPKGGIFGQFFHNNFGRNAK